MLLNKIFVLIAFSFCIHVVVCFEPVTIGLVAAAAGKSDIIIV